MINQEEQPHNLDKPYKVSEGLINADFCYDSFKLTNAEDIKKYKITRVQYSKIVSAYFNSVTDFILSGNVYRMRRSLGTLKIKRLKNSLDKKKLIPDWKRTVELWNSMYKRGLDKYAYKDIKNKKIVYFLNQHTDNSYYRIVWVKGMVKNISSYQFQTVRAVGKKMNKKITKENKQYF